MLDVSNDRRFCLLAVELWSTNHDISWNLPRFIQIRKRPCRWENFEFFIHVRYKQANKQNDFRSQYETSSTTMHLHGHPVDSCQFGSVLFTLTMLFSKIYGHYSIEWLHVSFHTFLQEFH